MKRSIAIAAGLLTVSAGVHAETLSVNGVYPADADSLAPIQSIAVETFGGVDGAALSLGIEDQLRDIYVYRKPWFAIVPALGGAEADAILRGTAASDVSYEDIRLTRNRCVQRDEERKCIEHKDIEVDCLRRTVTLSWSVRLVAWRGDLLYREDNTAPRQLDYCPRDDDNVQTVEATVKELIDSVAPRFRYKFAPVHSNRTFRVLESRKGLKGLPEKDFKQAVKLTKSDQSAACVLWEGIAQTYPEHLSTTFNLGLCAERSGDWEMAEEHYRHALRISPGQDNAEEGIRRLNAYRRAAQQIDIHWGQ